MSSIGIGSGSKRENDGLERIRPLLAGAAFVLGLFVLGAASPALALDEIAISPGATEEAADACPALTRIKYPWSSCGEGFALGFEEGTYGEPPESQCRLYMRNGMCAATTQPWNGNYLGLKRHIDPEM